MSMLDPTDLTKEQQQAFNSLSRALKKCEKANIHWYQVLETLHPLNGDVVECVRDLGTHEKMPLDAFPLGESYIQSVITDCSWADDTHYVVFK